MLNRPRVLCGIALIALLAIAPLAGAKTIRVEPGDDAIAAAIRSANHGDVIALAPGEYRETIHLPTGMTLRGISPDETILIGQLDTAILVAGPRVTIRDIEVRGSRTTQIGIASSYPVRIERSRFTGLSTGVSFTKAPLSDVVFCEFINCETGVRAAEQASPTIWGCKFQGGERGIVADDGGPYIRNNFFHDLQTALTLRTNNSHTMIVRNNVITHCTSSAIELSRNPLQMPFASIRNNIISHCPVAVRGSRELFKGFTHCAIDQCEQFTDPAQAVRSQRHRLVTEELELTVNENGLLTIGNADALKDRGMRPVNESRGTKHDIGFTDGVKQPGCQPGSTVTAPPIRFESEPYIANASCEEQQFLTLKGLRMIDQSLNYRGEQRYNGIEVEVGGRVREIRFNVDRFYGESPFMQP